MLLLAVGVVDAGMGVAAGSRLDRAPWPWPASARLRQKSQPDPYATFRHRPTHRRRTGPPTDPCQAQTSCGDGEHWLPLD